jgi:hypothetical protein
VKKKEKIYALYTRSEKGSMQPVSPIPQYTKLQDPRISNETPMTDR